MLRVTTTDFSLGGRGKGVDMLRVTTTDSSLGGRGKHGRRKGEPWSRLEL